MCILSFSMPSRMICAASSAGIACIAASSSSACGEAVTPEFSVMAVATAPGITTVTPTSVSRSSAYRPSVIRITAALAAPYMVWPGKGRKPPMLATLTRCASGRSSNSGRNAFTM